MASRLSCPEYDISLEVEDPRHSRVQVKLIFILLMWIIAIGIIQQCVLNNVMSVCCCRHVLACLIREQAHLGALPAMAGGGCSSFDACIVVQT